MLVLVAVGNAACGSATVPTSPTLETSFTYASSLTSHGAASRTFTTYDAGNVTATLTSVSPAIVLGIGIGIPRSDGGGCLLTTAVETASGSAPQLSIRAESASAYCLKVFDLGRVAERAEFSVTVTHQ